MSASVPDTATAFGARDASALSGRLATVASCCLWRNRPPASELLLVGHEAPNAAHRVAVDIAPPLRTETPARPAAQLKHCPCLRLTTLPRLPPQLVTLVVRRHQDGLGAP